MAAKKGNESGKDKDKDSEKGKNKGDDTNEDEAKGEGKRDEKGEDQAKGKGGDKGKEKVSGQAEPDIEIVNCTTVRVRARRADGGNGRVYTMGWSAADSAGNHVAGVCHARVGCEQSPAVADAAASTVAVQGCEP